MTEKRKTAVDPVIPEIQTCPRCGEPILLGDTICSNCGYDVQSASDRLRSQPAIVITIGAFVIGTMIAIAGISMDNPWKFVALLIGFGFIVGGSLYYAADLLFLNKHNRRRKLD